jgi:PAS domain S-box-containing protein
MPSESPGSGSDHDVVRVLHVDDEPGFADLAATHLERASDRLSVETATSGPEALAMLADRPFDCVVSDYDMPEMDGLELLSAVREDNPDLPFVLFTGKGSEEIASEAISAGVDDYLQKGTGTEQYEVLANRVENVAERHRSTQALESSQRRLSLFVDQSPLGVVEWNTDLEVVEMNAAAEEILGYEAAELRGRSWEAIVPESDDDDLAAAIDQRLDGEGGVDGVTANLTRDGERIICEWHNHVVTDDDGEVIAVFSQFQDVTEREEYQRRLEMLISNLPGMVYRCRNEPDWPMEFVGGECEALTGYSASAIHEDGDVVWGQEVLHPEDRERAWDVVQSAVDDREPFELEYRIRTADDEIRWMWERGRGVFDADGDLVALEGFITDVTERVEREREASETNTVLTTLLEHLPVGVLVEDCDREIIAVNDRLCEVLGLDHGPEELRGADCAETLVEISDRFAEPTAVVERTEKLLDEREPVGRETLRLADGRTVERSYVPYALPDGEASLWLYRDVTGRERREWKLQQLQRCTQELMHTRTPEETAAAAVDAASDVLDVPLAAVHLLDDDGDSLVPVATVDRVAEALEDPPVFERASDDPIDAGVWDVYESGRTVVVEDTEDHDQLAGATPIRSALVHPLGDHGVLIASAMEPDAFDEGDRTLVDILSTALRAALDRTERERRLRESEADLTRENERLDTFASVVSHDLRNPLNVATGHLELARERHDDEHLAEVAGALDRMESLVEDLLTLAREGDAPADRQPVDVGQLAEHCLDNVDLGEATVEVETDATVLADRSRLAQVFENLFRNAKEHAGDAPTITVAALGDDTGFYVADDGPGIPPEEREEVFAAGYSRSRDGSGLGLSIVREVVEAHGWTVEVTGSESGGARFEIRTGEN